MTLLIKNLDQWASREVDTWKVSACPMSSASVSSTRSGLLGAWETAGKINVAWLQHPSTNPVTLAEENAKHPSIVSDGLGAWLVAWVEGTGWNRGGQAAWQELDATLAPRAPNAQAEGVPAWGRVAVYAEAPGKFVLLK